jgi:hypothetical protein
MNSVTVKVITISLISGSHARASKVGKLQSEPETDPLLPPHTSTHIHSHNNNLSTRKPTIIQPDIPLIHHPQDSPKMQAPIHESTPAGVDAPPYTAAEKKWLNVHWGGEFKFLQAYQLSIHDEDDREEGRRIARAFIHQDEMNAQSGGA